MKQLLVSTVLAAMFTGAVFVHANAWQMQPVQIQTKWAGSVDPEHVLPEYPRPQLVRDNWQSLNGLWQYAITAGDHEIPEIYEGTILVPYPVESALSGVKRPLRPDQLLWYRRTFGTKPSHHLGERTLLHFGAVDYQATIYLNDREIGGHVGGYQSFEFDITEYLKSGTNTLLVKVFDPTDTGPNPHGKQTLKPQGIDYTASSGIWQTVWLEHVPTTYIAGLKLSPDVDHGQLQIEANIVGSTDGYTIEAIARDGKNIIASEKLADRKSALPISNARLWSPDNPFLYDLQVRLLKGSKIVDQVQSYFGMRKIELRNDTDGIPRIFLNNQFTYNLGILDQGFWPESLYTAPTDAALQFDVVTIKRMGFNTIRKHIKVEPDRWYYHCDKVGLLVWQDMVPPANDSAEARAEFESEVKANIARLYNHPSITTWVVFNEGWGSYDQERVDRWVKQLDSSRLVNGHSGSSFISHAGREKTFTVGFAGAASDINDFHTYPDPVLSVVNPEKAQVIGEYGGVGVPVDGHMWSPSAGWSYVEVSREELAARYEEMIRKLKGFEAQGLSGSIYTQPYDVETELNGLMTYDRAVMKIPVAALNEMNQALVPGPVPTRGR